MTFYKTRKCISTVILASILYNNINKFMLCMHAGVGESPSDFLPQGPLTASSTKVDKSADNYKNTSMFA